jgi:hypothetical protein
MKRENLHEKFLENVRKIKDEIVAKIYSATPGRRPVATLLPDDILELEGMHI